MRGNKRMSDIYLVNKNNLPFSRKHIPKTLIKYHFSYRGAYMCAVTREISILLSTYLDKGTLGSRLGGKLHLPGKREDLALWYLEGQLVVW